MVVLKTEMTFLRSFRYLRRPDSHLGQPAWQQGRLEVTQGVWQEGVRCAVGKTIFCGFNFETHSSEPISDEFRAVFEKYRWDEHAN